MRRRQITPLLLPCNVCWCSSDVTGCALSSTRSEAQGWARTVNYHRHTPRLRILSDSPVFGFVLSVREFRFRDPADLCSGGTSEAEGGPETTTSTVLTTYPHKNRGSRRTKNAWRNNKCGFIRLAQLRAVTEFKAGYLKCTCLPVIVTAQQLR